MSDVYIVSAVRTPIGSFKGSLSSVQAHELGARVIKEALDKIGIEFSKVSEVILGQVFTTAQGQNPARRASMLAGLPHEVPAWNLNMLCGSGLKSVELGMQGIKCGDRKIVIAGGQESMSQTPHAIFMRSGVNVGNAAMIDTLLVDGLTDAFHNCHMGITAENVAKEYSITREDQDQFALNSQMKTKEAVAKGYFDKEIIHIDVKNKKGVKRIDKDEFPRPDSTYEQLSRLNPCFIRGEDGSVTAGNASGMNDGAAAVILMDEKSVKEEGIKPLVRIVASAQAGILPHIMGVGPIPAIKLAVKKAGWTLDEVDLFEINEAFASQSVACIRELQLDPAKVNVNGGAVSLGHPLGASGTRILVTLIHSMLRLQANKGVAALCIGGGMGIAMCIERC